MDSDSDSDEDLIPNMASLSDMFSSVHRQVRQEMPALVVPKPTPKSKSTSPKNDKATRSSNNTDTTKSTRKLTFKLNDESNTAKARCSTSPEKLNTSRLSDDTESLLAQAESLQLPPAVLGASKSTSAIKSKSGRSTEEDEKTETVSARSSRYNSRKRKKKDEEKKVQKKVLCVSLVEEEDDDDVATQEIFLDEMEEHNSSQLSDIMDVGPVEELWSVRIQWKGEILRFNFPVKTSISKVRMEVGQKLSMRADDLILFNEKTSEEVPDIQLVEHLPFGTTLDVFPRDTETDPKKLGPNYIQVKVQGCGGYRERLIVAIQRTTHVSQLIDDYVKKFGLEGKSFKLVFDGDTVGLDETADSLDLDGGEMFEIVEIS